MFEKGIEWDHFLKEIYYVYNITMKTYIAMNLHELVLSSAPSLMDI